MGTNSMRHAATLILLLSAWGNSLFGQVALDPASVVPGTWEQLRLWITNVADSPIVMVSIRLPQEVEVKGVRPLPEWPFEHVAHTDDQPGHITWHGGWISPGEFQEFTFIVRTRTDSDLETLVFPVTLTRVGGAEEEWAGRETATPAPRVRLARVPELSPRGAMMLGMIALGVSGVALAVSLAALHAVRRE